MDMRQGNSDNSLNSGGPDATRHLRDHLQCAQTLARSHGLPVVSHLIEMALLALSYGVVDSSTEK